MGRRRQKTSPIQSHLSSLTNARLSDQESELQLFGTQHTLMSKYLIEISDAGVTMSPIIKRISFRWDAHQHKRTYVSVKRVKCG